MFSLIKLGAILALAAPFASALDIKEITGNFVIGGELKITWTTANSDPVGSFTVELVHPSLLNTFALANNVDSSTLSLANVELPVVPITGSGFTIEFVQVDNIGVVFTVSQSFSIGAENTTMSATVGEGVVPKTSSTPISTPSLLPSTVFSSNKLASTTPSTVSVTAPASVPTGSSTGGASVGANAGGASNAASSPSPSTTGGALSVRSVSGALLAAVGAVAGALTL